MLVTLPLIALTFCRCFIEQTSALVLLQRVACDARHLSRKHKLMKNSGLFLVDFREHPFFPAFPIYICRWLVQLQHELHHELPDHVLKLLFRSLLVASSKRFCFAPASEHVVLSICSDILWAFASSVKFRVLLQDGIEEIAP